MKRIKPYVFTLLVIMTALCLSACGSNKNATQNQTTGGSTAAPTTQATTMAPSESAGINGTRADEGSTESTGVIDGMINDVERGVDNITGESGGRPTNEAGTDMSR